jgi:DNA-binding CsgD family transcriptional regulator
MGAAANDAVIGAVAKATLDYLEYAAVVCDADAELLVGNQAAHDLLERRDGLALREGRVCVSSPSHRERLQAVLSGAGSRGSRSLPETGTAALLVPRPSGLPAYQIIVREIDRCSDAFTNSPSRLWTMLISDPAQPPKQSVRALSALYNLTPAEARIAVALVSGETPDEIAERSGVKIATVRSQLASVYAKTGTRRQSELVRLFSAVPAVR